MKHYITLLLLLMFWNNVLSQENYLNSKKAELQYFSQIILTQSTDSAKLTANNNFKNTIIEILNNGRKLILSIICIQLLTIKN